MGKFAGLSPTNFMVKSMVSCKFSLKSIQFIELNSQRTPPSSSPKHSLPGSSAPQWQCRQTLARQPWGQTTKSSKSTNFIYMTRCFWGMRERDWYANSRAWKHPPKISGGLSLSFSSFSSFRSFIKLHRIPQDSTGHQESQHLLCSNPGDFPRPAVLKTPRVKQSRNPLDILLLPGRHQTIYIYV